MEMKMTEIEKLKRDLGVEDRPEIERWNPFDAKWERYATYLDEEHAAQNLKRLQDEFSTSRFRVKPRKA